ncbi:class I SAM-dependent methyltransferase [Rossellomorea sp. NS-SX7]|uniref:class I SAM-dependent methyltransferase n=1 Tax=Rossellomorea sp. NS-SX7 TaxID=3463856 RepID=UPI0040585002
MESLQEQYKDSSNLNTRINIHEKYSENKEDWHLWLFDQLTIPPTSRILEIGCGDGTFWLKNSERIDGSWNITLADQSAGMVEAAKKNLAALPDIKYCQLDIEEIPFEKHRFDIIIANHMLYHVPDRRKALKEVRRVLHPEGTFYCSTIGLDHMKEFGELLKRFDPDLDYPSARKHALNFGIENGRNQLQAQFNEITYNGFPGGLNITDENAIAEYLLSSASELNKILVNDTLSSFIEFLASEKESNGGAIKITKSTGLFASRN